MCSFFRSSSALKGASLLGLVLASAAGNAGAQTYPLLFDNGAFVTSVGSGSGGADISVTETGTVISLGFNANAASQPRVADDFPISATGPVLQRLARLEFYGTQTQTSNFTTNVNFGALYISVYNAIPSTGVAPIAGDFTTNRLLSSSWTGAYRVSSSSTTSQQRPITKLTADLTWLPPLPNGTYWFVISAVGDTSLTASPNPQTILVTPRLPTSNGIQVNNGTWVNTADYPFKLYGLCPGDFNASGTVSVQDIFDFLAAYFSNSPSADVNGSGAASVQDIFDFLAGYFTPCA